MTWGTGSEAFVLTEDACLAVRKSPVRFRSAPPLPLTFRIVAPFPSDWRGRGADRYPIGWVNPPFWAEPRIRANSTADLAVPDAALPLIERWRRVRLGGHDWPYAVSDRGRVRRIEPGPRTYVGREVKPMLNTGGYLHVWMTRGPRTVSGTRVDVLVHRLVAEAFLPPDDDRPHINHINSNRADPRVENLEWCTPAENAAHAIAQADHAGIKFQVRQGEANGSAKLTEDDVREIKRRLATKEPATRIARDYPVSDVVIGKIKRGRIWTHV